MSNTMYVENLSSNSAEHYYLMSEIEQKADFIHLNKPETQLKIEQHAMTFLYALWKPEKEETKVLLEKLQQLTDFANIKHNLHIPSTTVVIDCVISSNKVFNDAFKAVVNQLFQDIELVVPNAGLVIFGVIDNTAGTPGLEKIHDLIERILPGYVRVSKLANVISVTDIEMMGHDPSRDPDAESNVHQYLLYPYADMETKYLLTVFSNKNHALHNPAEEKRIPDIAAWEYFFGYLGFYIIFAIVVFTLIGYIYIRWFETSE
jgi:hypothetical protein